MNLNIKLNDVLQEKINAVAQAQLGIVIEELLSDEEELTKIVKDTLKTQVKSTALRVIQSPELRSDICQKIYPIVYKSLGLKTPQSAKEW